MTLVFSDLPPVYVTKKKIAPKYRCRKLALNSLNFDKFSIFFDDYILGPNEGYVFCKETHMHKTSIPTKAAAIADYFSGNGDIFTVAKRYSISEATLINW